MSDGAEIRDLEPSDVAEVQRIHEDSGLDYSFPDILSPLFIVKKVISIDGRVRACVGGYLTSEAYLWLDQSNWADPETKLIAIQELEKMATEEARAKGIEEVVLWLPPGMERFGERLVKDLGFNADRNEWRSYSKRI